MEISKITLPPPRIPAAQDVVAAPSRNTTPQVPELSRVKAIVDIRQGANVAHMGSTGTVVEVVQDGAGYVVEFNYPAHFVVAVRPTDVSSG